MKLLIPLAAVLALAGVAVVAFRKDPGEAAPWPPVVGERYPDLELTDRNGDSVRLSTLEGRVILLEPIGMSCPACQAFAGAHRVGALGRVRPQAGLPSIEEAFDRRGEKDLLEDPRLVRVHLLLYDLKMGVPTPADVAAWADRFATNGNEIVLAGTAELQGDAGYNLVPGFQLIDRSFVLRVDSTGHHPRHDLWTELLPSVSGLLAEPR